MRDSWDTAPPTLYDYLYLFYERAAIGEFDGGLSRTAAEPQSLDAVLAMFATDPKIKREIIKK